MKKILALLLAMVLVLSLAACNNNTNNPTDPTNAPTDPTDAPTDPTDAPTDPTDPPVDVMTKAEFDAAALQSPVVVETYIQAVESWYNGVVQLYTQNDEGGYYIYNLACTEDEAAKLVPGTKIRVSGYKAEWSGEIEIIDATYEILEGTKTYETTDVTALFGTDELIAHQNELVSIKGATIVASTIKDDPNEYAFLYKWDGSGSQGSDLYFNVAIGEQVYTFTVNVYMLGTGVDSDVYKAIEGIKIGDKIDLEGFLYWYNGAQPHITSVTVSE